MQVNIPYMRCLGQATSAMLVLSNKHDEVRHDLSILAASMLQSVYVSSVLAVKKTLNHWLQSQVPFGPGYTYYTLFFIDSKIRAHPSSSGLMRAQKSPPAKKENKPLTLVTIPSFTTSRYY